ncbi:hypothetical protein CHUAL_009833 [Chamberlinius hualienensis]
MTAVELLFFSAVFITAFASSLANYCKPLSSCTDEDRQGLLCMYVSPTCRPCFSKEFASNNTELCSNCKKIYLQDTQILNLANTCDQCEVEVNNSKIFFKKLITH